ncbi:MAG TPA: TetR family transcriptional regulator [Acidimicrobiales bacterium]|nr:TetR family transcriptional regulator [Acidimicrobiales bacterium]
MPENPKRSSRAPARPERTASATPEGETVSLRRRFSAFVTEEIEQLAIGLFAERGYDAVTVEEIAAAAGISQRTFFRYFGSKDDLLLRDQHRRLERLRHALSETPPEEDPRVSLHRALVTMAEADDDNAADVAVRSAALATRPGLIGLASLAEWAQPIVAIVAERLGVDPETDPQPVVMVLAALAAVAVGYGMWANVEWKGPVSVHVDRALSAL